MCSTKLATTVLGCAVFILTVVLDAPAQVSGNGCRDQTILSYKVAYLLPFGHEGTLNIGNGQVEWQASNHNDSKYSFKIALDDIKEVRQDFAPSEFHIRLKSGKHYTFRGLDRQGKHTKEAALAVLGAIQHAMSPDDAGTAEDSQSGAGYQLKNKITFENQSGTTAAVRLSGPSSQEIELQSGSSVALEVLGGNYSIEVRYGTAQANYIYSRAGFAVKETDIEYSKIKITLKMPEKDDPAAHFNFNRVRPC